MLHDTARLCHIVSVLTNLITGELWLNLSSYISTTLLKHTSWNSIVMIVSFHFEVLETQLTDILPIALLPFKYAVGIRDDLPLRYALNVSVQASSFYFLYGFLYS